MLPSLSRVYLLLGLCGGYVLVMLFNPAHQALRDGSRCIGRFKRVWVIFVVLGLAYVLFQFTTFTPIQTPADLDLSQIMSVPSWQWPTLGEVWRETPLPALEGVAGIFDNATTTYPLSVVAAVLLILNWRGLHGALLRALRKRYRFGSYFIYLILLVSALATLFKPIVFWQLPHWGGVAPAAGLLQTSATVDAVAFIFEYLFGVFIQVYLISVCLAWVKGVSFEEGELGRFAMRRFSYVLKWAGVVVLVSMLIVRMPLLLAYFMQIPNVLDYLPLERAVMSTLIIAFCSVQISLVLHNETLGAAIRAHRRFIAANVHCFGWFLFLCGTHFFLIIACDAVARGAISNRLGVLFLWKCFFVSFRGLITGWLLASWVCLFRQRENARVVQESRIQY